MAMARGRSSGSSRLISLWETTACTTAERKNPRISGHRISHPMANAMANACEKASMIMFAPLHDISGSGQLVWGDHVPISSGVDGASRLARQRRFNSRPCDAFVHEGEWIPPLHVSGVELFDVK